MADPIPYVVAQGGSAGAAPEGSIPIALYGAGGGGGGSVDSVNGQVGDVELGIADIPSLTEELGARALNADVNQALQSISQQFTTTNQAVSQKLETSTFTAYTDQATEAFVELESAVETNTSNLATTTSTANSAVQPNNVRLPIVIPQDVYDALEQAGTLIPDQLYFTTAPEA